MFEEMNITSAQYFTDITGNNVGIIAVIDDVEYHISLTNDSRRYVEIMRQVEAGTLTIQEAD
jgi:hypothetical protein